MSRRFFSENARRIQRKFKEASAHIKVKYVEGMDIDTQEVYNDALIQTIEELDGLLRQQSVRGHNDPSILSPDVNNRSAILRIVRRLERQITAICVLADIVELGPAANADEVRVLSRGDQLMDRLYETVSPEASLRDCWNNIQNYSEMFGFNQLLEKAFGMSDDESPSNNPTFVNLSKTIQAFFYKLIITYQLDDDLTTTACERLGSRHVDFISRGFHSTFWDIFLVCMAETIDTTLSSYITDETRKAELLLSWQRVINAIIHHMRNGYSEQRKAQLQKQQEKA